MAKKSTKKVVITLVGVIVLGAVIALVATCPDRMAHKEALSKLVVDYSNMKKEEAKKTGKADGLSPDAGENKLGELSQLDLLNIGFEELLDVHNWYLFSIGYMKTMNGESRVSFGILNKVFTPSMEAIDRAVKAKSPAQGTPKAKSI